MRSVKIAAAVGTALCLSLPIAKAADMPMPVPPPLPVEDFGGWYLRGDIGMTNQTVGDWSHYWSNDPTFRTLQEPNFSSSMLFGLGVGYSFNSWLRADVTGEYRSAAKFHSLDAYPGGSNQWNADKSEWTFLANAYLDLGTWWCVTPFVGAGVGFSYNTIANLTDVNVPTQGVAYANDNTKLSFAWALHAGLAYKVTPGFTVELAYRYLNLGSAVSGDEITYTGVNAIVNPVHFDNLYSHDIKLGVRWMLQPEPMARPLVTKG